MPIIDIATLNDFILNTSIKLTYVQVIKDGIIPINIFNKINPTIYTYAYYLVNSEEIFNNYVNNGRPILLIYFKHPLYTSSGFINIYDTTTEFDIRSFVYSKLIKPTTIVELNTFLLYVPYTLTFIQVVKTGILPIDNLSNIIISTNYEHSYTDVSSTEIYNTYSNNGKPILLLFLNYNSLSTIGSIAVSNTTKKIDITDFIYSRLEKPTTNEELKLYLKYTKYTTIFIRLYNCTPTIKSQTIINLLEDYNKPLKTNYEYFELNQEDIYRNIDYFPLGFESLPVMMLFKKSIYNTVIPCKTLAGEDYYTDQTVIQLQNFLRNGLK